ncbi:MAG: zinc-ribbon domain-containing protein [Neisseriaceae bacterium]|nr:zinc-ribbon domain-containing protein [Neisseriaceae bacterium]
MNINKIAKFGEMFKDSALKTKENWKIDTQIKELQNELSDAYRILGFAYYEKMKANDKAVRDSFNVKSKNLIEEIDQKSNQLATLRESKTVLTQKRCEQCSKEVPNDSLFCPYCGASCKESAADE